MHQPQRVGIGLAFMFGLAMDVHQSSLLGQHALSYTALSFFATMIHRRLLWFSVPSQAVQVLPLFAVAHGVELIIRMIGGGIFPGWIMLLAPLAEALLWPVVSILLLVPHRRAPNRPPQAPSLGGETRESPAAVAPSAAVSWVAVVVMDSLVMKVVWARWRLSDRWRGPGA